MALVIQKKGSLSGGVSEESAEHRLNSQVEEMINCVPTLDKGLRLRNSTAPIKLIGLDGNLAQVTFPEINETAYVYEYDRGVIGERNSDLAFMITQAGGLEIIDLSVSREEVDGQDILAGTLYKDGAGINYADDNARAYLGALVRNSDYAMTTVKDTTFIVNKTFKPQMIPTFDDNVDEPILLDGSVTVDYNSITGENTETVTGANGVFVFEPPVDVTEVEVCMCGGGGSGSVGGGGIFTTGGGRRGSVHNGVIPVTEGVSSALVVGIGGAVLWLAGSSGRVGGETSFDTTVAAGGAGGTPSGGHTGNGGKYASPCGGITRDGLLHAGATSAYGGQAGAFGDGGRGLNDSFAGGGGIGAGGGAAGYSDSGGGQRSGAGGNGRIVLKWKYPVDTASTDYLRAGYIWIKRVSFDTGYKYGAVLTIKKADGTKDLVQVPFTASIPEDSTAVADALAELITTAITGRGVANAFGSIVKIVLNEDDGEELLSVDAIDTFGDLASFGWAHSVDYQTDLPPNMSGFNAIVEVGEPRKPTYWLIYTNEKWREYHRPQIYTQVDPNTMPHTITRRMNEDENRYEFYVEPYTWDARKVGDNKTNKLPTMINPVGEDTDRVIKDIFFFRNRLGFISDTSIVLSEVGEYGNLFRTSVAALLDSDRIDALVESTNAVSLEYAPVLQDSVILFADKAQFRFRGGASLTPSNYSIQQEMAYDVNIAVRPLFMNDRLFFVARRGFNSAVYEMQISNASNQSSSAVDITAHCQGYVDSEIEKLTGSSVNNTLFLTSKVGYSIGDAENPIELKRNTVFVYKYYDNGNQRVQSAWSKWTFNGDLLSGFALSKNFYLLIDRNSAIEIPDDWVMGTGEWQMTKPWMMDEPWIMRPLTLAHAKQFERLAIYPRPIQFPFLDNLNTPIEAVVNLGELTYGADGNKRLDGNLLLKTLEVRTEEGSEIKLWVEDTQRGSYREVPAKYLIGRKPMIYGNSKRVKVGFKNSGITGFRLDEVLFEANRVRRNTSR